MHLIHKWIESEQNFEEGLGLLKSFNGSGTWLNLFQKLGETTYTRVELYKQLDTLLGQIEADFIPEKPIIIQDETTRYKKDLPLIIRQIEDERKENYKQSNRLHHSMVLHVESMIMNQTPVVDAKAVVYELRDLWDKIDDAWTMSDDYNSTGKIPKQKEIVKMKYSIDINHAADRRRTLKTYLTVSYLKRIPEDRRAKFVDDTKVEIDYLDNLITENASIIQLR